MCLPSTFRLIQENLYNFTLFLHILYSRICQSAAYCFYVTMYSECPLLLELRNLIVFYSCVLVFYADNVFSLTNVIFRDIWTMIKNCVIINIAHINSNKLVYSYRINYSGAIVG